MKKRVIPALTEQKAGAFAKVLGVTPDQAKQSYAKFVKYLSERAKEGTEMLNKYNSQLNQGGTGAKGVRRMTGGKLLNSIHMKGGSWGDFTSWVKGAASTVGNAIKSGAKAGWEYFKNKPLSVISKLAGAASMLPTPASGVLKGISAATGTVGNAIGKGYEPSPYAPLLPKTSNTFDLINSKRIVMMH